MRRVKLLLGVLGCLFILGGCSGISQEEYDQLQEEVNNYKEMYEEAQAEINEYKGKYESSLVEIDEINKDKEAVSNEVQALQAELDGLKNETLDKAKEYFDIGKLSVSESYVGKDKVLVLVDYSISLSGDYNADRAGNVVELIGYAMLEDWWDYDYVFCDFYIDGFGRFFSTEIGGLMETSKSVQWPIE